MKIAYVVHDYKYTAGHSRYVVELASRFCREHEVHVFANTFEGANPAIRYHHVPAWRISALATILTFAVFSPRKISGHSFDVVHLQGFCGPGGNVITTHRCNETWFRALEALPQGVSWKERLFHFVTAGLERRLYRKSSEAQVIAISKLAAGDIRQAYGCEAETEVIYHGVDLTGFAPGGAQAKAKDQPREFLYVGDLRKGAMACIRAMTKVPSAILAVVSRSETGPYRAEAERLGVAGRIQFRGFSGEMAKVYQSADYFLSPTPYDEFGMVIAEAMACGLPVIASRRAGAAEWIEHGENGLILHDPADDGELAGHMLRLLADHDLAGRLGTAARATAERHSWDQVAESTMAVYHRAASRGQGKS